jgi:uncharacterized protein
MESRKTSPVPARHRLVAPYRGRSTALLAVVALVVVTAISLLVGGCGSSQEAVVVAGGAAGAEDTITVTGKATIQTAPDEAVLTLTVETEAAEPGAALDANSTATTQVIERLKTEGVEDQAIETTNVAVYPIRTYDPDTGKESLTGYRAQNSVTVTLSDPATVGRVLAASVESGATNVSGPVWRLSEDSAAINEALGKAVDNARAKAEAVAAAAGVGVGQILMMSEGSVDQPSPLVFAETRAVAEDAVAEPPVSPGTLDVTATVTVSYELQR